MCLATRTPASVQVSSTAACAACSMPASVHLACHVSGHGQTHTLSTATLAHWLCTAPSPVLAGRPLCCLLRRRVLPAARPPAEDDGFLLVYTTAADASGPSFLNIYDAATMDPEPLAQVGGGVAWLLLACAAA